MTFTPTKEELEELGFYIRRNEDFYTCEPPNGKRLAYVDNEWRICDISSDWDTQLWGMEVYPQSLEDLKTLIRLLTPPHEK